MKPNVIFHNDGRVKSVNGKTPMPWQPGMTLLNANGDIDPASLGYEYATQTTTLIRAKVIPQKFYKVAPAEFLPIDVGEGAYMEDIKTNLTFDAAGDFESGIIQAASGPSRIAEVDAGLVSMNSKIITWAKGYQYTIPEVQKALASDNWDLISSRYAALKRNWDLGIQKIAFLGSKVDSSIKGLLTLANVNINTALITAKISGMSTANFQALVAALLAAYFANTNSTELPDTFLMPMQDYLGMGVAASPDFPVGPSKLQFLLQAFREITGNASFKIKGLAYADQANNAGYVADNGKNRYVLYKQDMDTLSMFIPVDFTPYSPNTANNFQFNGVAAGQFGGVTAFRPLEILYLDWAV